MRVDWAAVASSLWCRGCLSIMTKQVHRYQRDDIQGGSDSDDHLLSTTLVSESTVLFDQRDGGMPG